MTEKIGPVRHPGIGFASDAEFEGRIMTGLEGLDGHETIRVIDLLFVDKDAETGELLALDYQGEDLGAIVGALGLRIRGRWREWNVAARSSSQGRE